MKRFLLLLLCLCFTAQAQYVPRPSNAAEVNVAEASGATLTAKIQNIHDNVLPATGGVIDASSNRLNGAQSLGALTITKPVKIIFGRQTITTTGSLTINNAGNVEIVGAGNNATVLTTPNSGNWIVFGGNYSSNKNYLRIAQMKFVAGTGTSRIIYDSSTHPSALNFNESRFIFEDNRVTGFNTAYAIHLGDSFYYNKIERNNFNSNQYAIRTGRFSDTTVLDNMGSAFGEIRTFGCNARFSGNSFVPGTQTTPNIVIDASANGADGIIYIGPNNKFGPEGEYVPRTVTDGVTNGTTTITSATANFASTDVGIRVTGTNIPSGATIASVTNATTAVLSSTATGSDTGGTISLLSRNKIVVQSATSAGYVIPDVQIFGNKFYAGTNFFGQTAIEVLNPIRAVLLQNNYFDGFAYCINDAQGAAADGEKADNSKFIGNIVTNRGNASLAGSVSRTFVNGGRGFIEVDDDFHGDAIPPQARFHDAAYLINRVAYSDTFSSWTKSTGVTVTGGQTDPFGGTTASLVTRPGSATFENIHTSIETGSVGSIGAMGTRLVLSFWAKAGDSTMATVGLRDVTDSAFPYLNTLPLSSTWKRFSMSCQGLNPAHSFDVRFYPSGSGTPAVAGSMYIARVQVSDADSDFIATNGAAASGTNPVLAKVYRALLTQIETGDPTATVLENTLGGTVTWARTSVGTYTATLSNAFTANKTFVNVTSHNPDFGAEIDATAIDLTSASVITVRTGNIQEGAPTLNVDGHLAATPIQILVYP